MKNLFDFATKELSQDAFLRWIFENYDCENKTVRKACEKLFKRFTNNTLDFSNIESLSTTGQWNKIDVSVWFKCAGKEYLIVVEDKTLSEEHNQLDGYNRKIEKHAQWLRDRQKNLLEEVFKVFYKTAKISKQEKERVEKAGWTNILDISDIYRLFSSYQNTGSEVLDYYVEHIQKLYNVYNDYRFIPFQEWRGKYVIFQQYSNEELKELAESYEVKYNRSEIYQGKYTQTFIQKYLPNNITLELGLFFKKDGFTAWIKGWDTNVEQGWNVLSKRRDLIWKSLPSDTLLKWEKKRYKNRVSIVHKELEEFLNFSQFDEWIKKCFADYVQAIKNVSKIPNLG